MASNSADALNFYWQSNIYSREAWVAQWNALAVVNALLLGAAITLMTSDIDKENKTQGQGSSSQCCCQPPTGCTNSCFKVVIEVVIKVVDRCGTCLSKILAPLPSIDIEVFKSMYRVCVIGLIVCCIGGVLTSTVYVMEINTKAQPVGFGDAENLAKILQHAPACKLFGNVSGQEAYTPQQLGTGVDCNEHNTVDNHIRRLMCSDRLHSALQAPTNFTWAAFVFFALTVTFYIAAKFDPWLTVCTVMGWVVMVISAAVIFPASVGTLDKQYGSCNW